MLHRLFALFERKWRSSPVCFILFQTIFVFSLLSQFGLFFLSLTRLMVVLHPLYSSFKRTSFVQKRLIEIFLSSLFLSFMISVPTTLSFPEVPISLCLPFVDPTGTFILIRIITYFVAITQAASCLSILVMHIYLVKYVQIAPKLGPKSQGYSHGHKKHVNRILQLFILTLSNLLCWLPGNTIFLVVAFFNSYPLDLITWTAVTITPLNSLINPLVFFCVNVKKHFDFNWLRTEKMTVWEIQMVNTWQPLASLTDLFLPNRLKLREAVWAHRRLHFLIPQAVNFAVVCMSFTECWTAVLMTEALTLPFDFWQCKFLVLFSSRHWLHCGESPAGAILTSSCAQFEQNQTPFLWACLQSETVCMVWRNQLEKMKLSDINCQIFAFNRNILGVCSLVLCLSEE